MCAVPEPDEVMSQGCARFQSRTPSWEEGVCAVPEQDEVTRIRGCARLWSGTWS